MNGTSKSSPVKTQVGHLVDEPGYNVPNRGPVRRTGVKLDFSKLPADLFPKVELVQDGEASVQISWAEGDNKLPFMHDEALAVIDRYPAQSDAIYEATLRAFRMGIIAAAIATA